MKDNSFVILYLSIYQSKLKNIDCCTLFEGIVSKVYAIFKDRKKLFNNTDFKKEYDILNYNYCNLTLTSPESKLEKISEQEYIKTDENKEKK